MKTIKVGLIPISTLRHFASGLRHAMLIAILTVFLTPVAFATGPDDWPEMAFYSPEDLVEPISNGMSMATSAALACRPNLQVSLSQLGSAEITAKMMLYILNYPEDQYTVDIDGPLTDSVFCEQIGQTLMATVKEIPSGNTCMSQFTVEDKLPPMLTCLDDTIPCYVEISELDFLSFINNVEDNCTPFEDLELIYSYTVTEFDCDPGMMAGRIDVTYTATDLFGNSSECSKSIYLMKFPLDSVKFPADTLLSCLNPDYSIENVGEPTIDGVPVDHFCELISWSTETVIPLCSGSFKVARLWKVMDWCTGETLVMMQSILIKDTIPPVIDCPANVTLSTDPTVCYATYVFPNPDVTDACSDDDLIVTLFKISGSPVYHDPGDMIQLPPGDYTVTVKATDDCYTTGTCQYTITVIDDEPPVVVCHNLSTNLNDMGISILRVDSLDFFFDDNCGIDSISVRKMVDICGNPQDTIFGDDVTFCCAEAGTSVMVVVKVIDVHGNESICMFEMQVKDATPPVAICRDICVYLDINGFATITPDSIDNGSYDNCEIVSLEIDRDSFDCKDIGPGSGNPHNVTLTVTDASGNVSTCIGQVTVKDTLPPEAFCMDITVLLDSTGFAMITWEDIDAGSIDNCEIVYRQVTPDTFSCADVGDTVMVELIVEDWSGNRDTCIAKVFVMDNPPTVICKDVTLSLDSMGMVIVMQDDIDEVMDDCGIDSVHIDPDKLGCANVGVNIVVLTVTDVFGNTASCEAQVTVIDIIAPVCRSKDITVMLDENGMVTIDSNAVDNGSTDECGLVEISIDQPMFNCSNVNSPVVVTQTVTDASGNTSTCTATVTVENNIPPECSTMDITVYVDENGMVTIANDAVNAGSSAACGIDTIQVFPNMFDCGNITDNMVTQTVTDVNGLVASCTAIVTVEDTIAPSCLTMDIAVYLDANGLASISDGAVDAGSDDNCAVLSITLTPKDFTCADVGTVSVTQTVTDVNTNVSMCDATVTVIDTIAPTCITMDITVNLDENGTITIPDTAVDNGSSDACGIADIMLDQTMFSCSDGDSTIVTMTVTDVNGNTSTCTAVVHITNTGGPSAICNDTTIYLDANGMVSITPEDVDGGSGVNCGMLSLEIDTMDFTCADIGDNFVTLTVTDESGATATCIATVTVLDTISPICLAQNVTVYLDVNGDASITVGDVDNGSSDNCSVDLSVDPTQFTCADIGTVIVTLTATDPSMNTSTCEATVTVEDTIAPICMAVDTIFITLPGNGMASITVADVNDGSTDNCSIMSLEIDIMDFTCDNIGNNTVTLTVTDVAGNISTCQTIVVVEDGANFECSAMDITVFLDENGMVVIVPGDVDNGSGGGCNSETPVLSLDQTMFDCGDIGIVEVTLTVTTSTDTLTCMANVTIIDNLPPVIVCPVDMTVDCGTDLGDLSQFGMATATDNCPGVTIAEVQTPEFDDCGAGSVTRVFTATDASGNTAVCTQVITVGSEPLTEADIIWPPASIDLPECSSTDPGDIPGSEPVVDIPAGSCAQLSITFADSTVTTCDTIPATPCVVVFRTWTVFDSCDAGNMMFTFDQVVTVFDSTGPVFTPIADITVDADSDTCTAEVTLVAMATDCGMAVSNITNDFNDGGADASGTYPFGNTTVVFTAEDACCNISTLTVTVTVNDPGNPTFTCFKPIVCIPADGDTMFSAQDFIIFTNPSGCSTIEDYFYSFSNDDPFDSDTTADCGDVGDVLLLEIWIWNQDLMKIDSCFGDLEINDGGPGGEPTCPDQNCSNANLTIGGSIFNEDALKINQVPVIISESGMNPTQTNGSGAYEFKGLTIGGSYAVGPYDNTGPLEGVSTLDLVEIQKHLLGLKELNSPYKLIAADVDGNRKLTVLDLLELRKLLLGVIPTFANNSSWRFVDAKFNFPDPYNPFMTDFPEEMIIGQLMESKYNVDFVGVKTGDVNNTFTNVNSPEKDFNSSTELVLTIQEKDFKAGELVQIPVRAANFDDLAGFQFGLTFDKTLVQYVGVETPSTSVMDESNFGWTGAEDANILVSWSTGVGVTRGPEEVLFTVQFKAKRAGSTSGLLSISNQQLAPQAYVDGGEISINSVDLFVSDSEQIPASDEFALLQNRPNPFTDQTEIPFYTPDGGKVELLIHSVDGRLMYSTKQDVSKGFQTFILEHADLDAIGIYYYTIITDKNRATRKLTVLD